MIKLLVIEILKAIFVSAAPFPASFPASFASSSSASFFSPSSASFFSFFSSSFFSPFSAFFAYFSGSRAIQRLARVKFRWDIKRKAKQIIRRFISRTILKLRWQKLRDEACTLLAKFLRSRCLHARARARECVREREMGWVVEQ